MKGKLVTSQKHMPIKRILLVLFGLFLVSMIPLQAVSALSITFDPKKNLSQTGTFSTLPEIVSNGDNVYVIWKDDTDIRFINSTDGGDDFPLGNSKDIGDVGTSQGNPKLAIGNNIYSVWRETNDIKFSSSTDGKTFSTPTDISGTAGTASQVPQIAELGTNVFVVWQEGGFPSADILLKRITNDGADFTELIKTIGDTNSVNVIASDIVATGTKVYVVWQDGGNIMFINGTNNGANFDDAAESIGSSSGQFSSSPPQLAVSGSNVYAVWQQGTNISFARSTDGGSSFGTTDIGDTGAASVSTPQIAISGNFVYVVWQNGNDINFARNTNNGDPASWSTPSDRGDTGTTAAATPTIAADGTNVFLAWKDITTDAKGEIRFNASDDNGATFENTPENLSSDASSLTSITPQLAASNNNVYAIWSQEGSPNDIMFRSGTTATVSLDFDKSQYKLSETAQITVIDTTVTGSGSIVLDSLISSSDGVGIAGFTLNENPANSGTFVGSLTFGDTTTGTQIETKAGDTITAEYKGQNKQVSVFPITITFKLASTGGTVVDYDYGNVGRIQVEDQNVAGAGQIVVNIKSTLTDSDPDLSGITLTLLEDAPNSGIFGSTSKLIFPISEKSDKWPASPCDFAPSCFTVITVNQTFPPGGDQNEIDTKFVQVKSDSDGTGITLELVETGVDTREFEKNLILTSDNSVPATSIKAVAGDIVGVTSSVFTANALVIPNSNPSLGAILVDYPTVDPVKDTVTVEYGGVSAPIDIEDKGAGGGGGGGLVRPGLIVNAVGALALFNAGGLGGSGGPPSIVTSSSSNPFESASGGFGGTIEKQSPDDLIPGAAESGVVSDSKESKKDSSKPVTFKKNEKVVLDFDIFETRGDLKHATLYMNEGEIGGYLEEFTYIRWDDNGLTVNDEKGIFDEADFEIIEKEDGTLTLRFTMAFGSEVGESDVMLKVWNFKRQGANIVYEDAFKVTDSDESISESLSSEIISETSQEIPKAQEIPEIKVESEPKDKSIPGWIKTSASWWSENQINDKDFVLGLEHLIKEDIIQIPKTQINTDKSQNIPGWIKSTAGWWSEGGITDDEFKNAVQWLIENGVMKV